MPGLQCSTCGAATGAAQRFCGACGAPLSVSDWETFTGAVEAGQPLAAAAAVAGTPARIASDARFLPGQIVGGRFRMLSLLGRAGMGGAGLTPGSWFLVPGSWFLVPDS